MRTAEAEAVDGPSEILAGVATAAALFKVKDEAIKLDAGEDVCAEVAAGGWSVTGVMTGAGEGVRGDVARGVDNETSA